LEKQPGGLKRISRLSSTSEKRQKFLHGGIPIVFSLAADALLVFFSDLTAFYIRFGIAEGPFPRRNIQAYIQLIIPIIVLRLLCFYIYGLYSKPKYKTTYDIVLSTFKATSSSTLIIVFIAFMARTFAYPRPVIFYSWVITIPIIVLWRLISRRLINRMLGKNYFVSHVLIIGADRESRRVATRLVREARIHRHLVGFVRLDQDQTDFGDLLLGTLEELPELALELTVDEVVIASPIISREQILSLVNHFAGTDVIFRIVPGLYEATIGSMSGSLSEEVPLISPTTTQRISWYPDLKRLGDTFGAVLGMIILSPLMLAVALAVRLTSPGPVIYHQRRAGIHGKVFILYKFRTMEAGSEENGARFTQENDERVTRLGRFLRRFRIDELPQLYNVLINDMSLVGPRPERPVFIKDLMNEIPFYIERLAAKPGLTGWAQVTRGYCSTLDEHREKLLYDIFYIENMSPALDLLIILRTIAVVLSGKGA